MSFIDRLRKNGFKSLSEKAIESSQGDPENKSKFKSGEEIKTNKISGITKRNILSKAGIGNTDMGRREVIQGNKNYFANNFLGKTNKIIGENMYNTKGNIKTILESMMIQEGLTDLIRNNAGKIATVGTLAAGAAAGHALSGGDFGLGDDNNDSGSHTPQQKGVSVKNSDDALTQAKQLNHSANIEQTKVDYNQRPSALDTINKFADHRARAIQNEEYNDALDDARKIKDNTNPSMFTFGEKVGLGVGGGALAAGILGGGALGRRSWNTAVQRKPNK